MTTPFDRLGVRKELTDELRQHGLVQATPVQTSAIPVLLSGADAIVQAQTGTGKTLAFALPILEKIRPDNSHVQALILTPTRELALQITQEFNKLASIMSANVLAAYGGQDVEAQIRKLEGRPHIVVGTPGRLLDHLRRRTIRLSDVSMLVLDEADQMLHMGFLTEVEELIMQTPERRQTMLFSATMPDAVRRLAQRYMKNPEDIRIRTQQVTLTSIKQLAVETTDRAKQDTLLAMIEQQRPYLAVVFCRTKVRAKKLNEALQEHGLLSDELHGDLTQAKREQVMRRFRSAKLQLLVATDVAARGIDVEGVTHVYNYDIPLDGESYIHRIGRTGRAGQKGMAITLFSPRDRQKLASIERTVDEKLERRSSSDFGVGPASPDEDYSMDTERAPRASRGKQTARSSRETAGRSGGRSGEARRGAGRTAGRREESNRGGRPAGRGRDDARGAGGFAERGGESSRGGGRPAGRGRDDARGAGGFAERGGESSRGGGRPAGRGRDDARGAGGFAERGGESSRGGGRPAGRGRDDARGAGRPAGRGSDSPRGGGKTSSGRGGTSARSGGGRPSGKPSGRGRSR
ncbi:DEAD/DEAH box helicase [Paenibacillus sambharensis]|uniref:DEAD/DEAH box helicase n=1 Tax=Paenibacillus sambharensis TaxID=1803190 RepID=A0A2W1LM40_9BACL|nr:DEAD/DEAH box helicase [Paenibacillus sambharensis]PZD96042.1 DEAD/DEAH box helicase [Paenibacillus sambharensis]